MNDPAWDMPLVNWLPQSSYVVPVPIPASGPLDGTLVCIPGLNPAWIPYILGCLDQLRNPFTWKAADDPAMLQALEWVEQLRQTVASAAACAAPMSYALRFNGCNLEYSTDNGSTWAQVPGWDTFPQCVASSVVAQTQNIDQALVATPPNPNNLTPTQLACSISAYVAQQVLQAAYSSLSTHLQQASNVLNWALALEAGGLVFSTVFPITSIAIGAVAALFAWGSTVGYQVVSSISSDAVFWDDIKCAIYKAIMPDGKITPANWQTACANIGAINYSVPGAAAALQAFCSSLDIATVMEWQQLAGLDSADCSDCGWCYRWGAGGRALNSDWVAGQCATGGGAEAVYSGGAWASVYYAQPENDHLCAIELSMPDTPVTSITVTYDQVGGGDISDRYVEVNQSGSCANDGTLYPLQFGAGTYTTTININANVHHIRISTRTRVDNVASDTNHITAITLHGTGTNPLGATNC